jgi:hypothetical protein
MSRDNFINFSMFLFSRHINTYAAHEEESNFVPKAHEVISHGKYIENETVSQSVS